MARKGRYIDPLDIERIRELRAEGHEYKEIERLMGVSHHTVWQVTSGRYSSWQEPWAPSPDEIRAACRDIQSEWDADTERKRRAVSPLPWEAPELHVEV